MYQTLVRWPGGFQEIRAFINVRTNLGHSVKQIFTELGEIYGSHNVSCGAVRKWTRKVYTGTEYVTGATKAGRLQQAAFDFIWHIQVLALSNYNR